MAWGAGRPITRTSASARARIVFTRARWIVPVLTALAIVGPVRPFVLSAMTDAPHRLGVPSTERVRAGATDGGASWTVEVDLSDEVSQPFGLPDVAPPSTSKRHALIVGINNARGGKPLPGSLTDAKNMRNALLMYGFKDENIRMLLEGSASRDAIRRELASLATRTPSNGIAVFAVATHTRRYGGNNELLTADGLRISAGELASRLGAVRSRMWVALPTCYAAGYALPGIVGRDRVATFASSADRPSYQLGEAGSFLILNMVRHAMIERQAPGSVEDAFHWAKNTLEETSPDNVPSMSDGIPGDFVLGRVDAADPDEPAKPSAEGWSTQARPAPDEREGARTVRSAPDGPPDGSQTSGRGSGGVGVCGSFRARCDH
jgi:hypothetical protein